MAITIRDLENELTNPVPEDVIVVSDTSAAAGSQDKWMALSRLGDALSSFFLALTGNQTVAGDKTFSNRITVPQGIRSGRITLSQDAATSIPVPNAHAVLLIINLTGGGSGYTGMCRVRADSSPGTYGLIFGGNFAITTGVLTGTTGGTSTLTVSAHTDGQCYIENRRPLSQTFDYTWL